MLQAYNRCGAGKPEKDKQDENSNEEKSLLEGFFNPIWMASLAFMPSRITEIFSSTQRRSLQGA